MSLFSVYYVNLTQSVRPFNIPHLNGGEGNLRPRRPPREYLGEYTSWGKPKIPPADRILSHTRRRRFKCLLLICLRYMSLYEIYVIHATKHIRQRQTVSNWPVENFVIAVDVKPEVNSGDGLIISVDVVCYQVPGVRVCHLSVLLFVIPAPLTHCIADTQCPQTPHVHISTPCSNHHGQFVGTRSVVSCLLWPERCTGASSCGKIKSLNVWQTWDRNPSSVVRHMHKVYFSPFWDVLPHSDMTTSSIVCQCTTYITTSHSCSQTAEFIEPEQQPLKRLIASNRNNSHWRDWSHRTRTTDAEETDRIKQEQRTPKRPIASNRNNGHWRDWSQHNLNDFFSTVKFTARDTLNNFFYFGTFFFLKTRIRFGMSLVRFKKTWFSSDIIAIYYSCISKYYSGSGWHDFDVTDVTHNNDNK